MTKSNHLLGRHAETEVITAFSMWTLNKLFITNISVYREKLKSYILVVYCIIIVLINQLLLVYCPWCWIGETTFKLIIFLLVINIFVNLVNFFSVAALATIQVMIINKLSKSIILWVKIARSKTYIRVCRMALLLIIPSSLIHIFHISSLVCRCWTGSSSGSSLHRHQTGIWHWKGWNSMSVCWSYGQGVQEVHGLVWKDTQWIPTRARQLSYCTVYGTYSESGVSSINWLRNIIWLFNHVILYDCLIM